MVKSLTKLANESYLLTSVLRGETTYREEVYTFHEAYHPNKRNKLRNMVGKLEYDHEHLDRLVTDLNELSDLFSLFGEDW